MARGCAQCLRDLQEDVTRDFKHQTRALAALALLKSFVEGMEEHATDCQILRPEKRIRVTLKYRLDGEIATRSRLGCAFQLGSYEPDSKLPTVVMSMEEQDETTRLHMENNCLNMMPIEGARDVFDELLPVWKESDCVTRLDKRRRAWQWWKKEGHAADYEGTKVWRHVLSLDGTWHSAAVPYDSIASGLTGAICGVRLFIPEFVYSLYQGGSVQCCCTTVHDSRASDEKHPYYDENAVEKKEWSAEMVRILMSSSTDRTLAEKFAPSAANFGLMYAEVQEHLSDMKAADPVKIALLFSHCRNPGGATNWDVYAQDWQKNDITYKATGKDGRIIWTPIKDNIDERARKHASPSFEMDLARGEEENNEHFHTPHSTPPTTPRTVGSAKYMDHQVSAHLHESDEIISQHEDEELERPPASCGCFCSRNPRRKLTQESPNPDEQIISRNATANSSI